MQRSTLWLIFAMICIYLPLVLCDESSAARLRTNDSNGWQRSESSGLEEETRTKRHRHHLYSLYGFYGLAIAFLVKIKVIIVAFFVGSAVYMGLRYMWPHKCGGGIYKEGSFVLDHPPSSFAHHDHIPYSLDQNYYGDHHHYDSSSYSSSGPTSFDPYAAYSGNSYTESDGAPESIVADYGPTNRRRKRDQDHKGEENNKEVEEPLENVATQMVITEERIGEFMLNFLGLDTKACRRRFICEMEFRSAFNPLTAMAFRVIGRSIFSKYINAKNPIGKASSFFDCATVNAECVFIENNEDLEEEPAEATEDYINITESTQTEEATKENSLDNKHTDELQNEANIKAEISRNPYRRRMRANRFFIKRK